VLRQERDQIEAAILSLEQLARGRGGLNSGERLHYDDLDIVTPAG
jgi:hypothetical protein